MTRKSFITAMIFAALSCEPLAAEMVHSRLIFSRREYKPVGRSQIEWWKISLPNLQRAKLTDKERTDCSQLPSRASNEAQARAAARLAAGSKLTALSEDKEKLASIDPDFKSVRIVQVKDSVPLALIALPNRSEHWNYPQSIAWSPSSKLILVGSEAGSSTSHFEDYWLLDSSTGQWQYAGGGNDAKWSPDGSRILWSTPRELAPLGKLHVRVVHLELTDVRDLRHQILTSGISYESNFSWCR